MEPPEWGRGLPLTSSRPSRSAAWWGTAAWAPTPPPKGRSTPSGPSPGETSASRWTPWFCLKDDARKVLKWLNAEQRLFQRARMFFKDGLFAWQNGSGLRSRTRGRHAELFCSPLILECSQNKLLPQTKALAELIMLTTKKHHKTLRSTLSRWLKKICLGRSVSEHLKDLFIYIFINNH